MQIIFLKLKSRIVNLQLRQKKVIYTICPCFLHENYPFFQFSLFFCHVMFSTKVQLITVLRQHTRLTIVLNQTVIGFIQYILAMVEYQQYKPFRQFTHSFILVVLCIHSFLHFGSLGIYIHMVVQTYPFIHIFWQLRHLNLLSSYSLITHPSL